MSDETFLEDVNYNKEIAIPNDTSYNSLHHNYTVHGRWTESKRNVSCGASFFHFGILSMANVLVKEHIHQYWGDQLACDVCNL